MKLLAAASLLLFVTTAAAVHEVEDVKKRQGSGSALVGVILLEERPFR